MVYKIIVKKRFQNKLENILVYIEAEFGLLVARKFAQKLEAKFKTLQHQPYIGRKSIFVLNIRSIPVGEHNRIYYKVEGDKITIINMYDTRINPKRNTLR